MPIIQSIILHNSTQWHVMLLYRWRISHIISRGAGPENNDRPQGGYPRKTRTNRARKNKGRPQTFFADDLYYRSAHWWCVQQISAMMPPWCMCHLRITETFMLWNDKSLERGTTRKSRRWTGGILLRKICFFRIASAWIGNPTLADSFSRHCLYVSVLEIWYGKQERVDPNRLWIASRAKIWFCWCGSQTGMLYSITGLHMVQYNHLRMVVFLEFTIRRTKAHTVTMHIGISQIGYIYSKKDHSRILIQDVYMYVR